MTAPVGAPVPRNPGLGPQGGVGRTPQQSLCSGVPRALGGSGVLDRQLEAHRAHVWEADWAYLGHNVTTADGPRLAQL